MTKKEINNFLEIKKEIYNKISKIIGHNLTSFYNIVDYREFKWYVKDNNLFVTDEDCTEEYKINSYLNEGEKKFMGISDDCMYILTSLLGNDSLIILLDNNLKNK